jgi:putative ATP-dependent endonuclease of OLD family
MIFKSLHIKNFRNFKDISIELSNKNVIFGMNDTGKTNLLYALQFLLDNRCRRQGLSTSDYYKNDIDHSIEITLELSLEDRDEKTPQAQDTKYLISKVKNARINDANLNQFFISLKAPFDSKDLFGNPILKWGDDLNNLIDIPRRGEYYELDKIFKIIYVEPLIDMEKVFKANKRILFDEQQKSPADIDTEKAIEKSISEMNEKISSLELIGTAQTDLTSRYKNFRNEELDIELKSQISVNGYLDNLVPYIKWQDDDNYYPTSGDGRKKILSYAVLSYVTEKSYQDRIVVYLIEEPENSLHRAMQISLSQQLFTQQLYKYFFMTTHSSEILYEMDSTQLIRISQQKNSFSYLYNVPDEYKIFKKKLNKGLSHAIFYDKVLLVEGSSEYVLFEAVLSNIKPNYEMNASYLLQVDGINFTPYVKLLHALGIKWIVKTDNDLKAKKGNPNEFDLIGLNRCLDLMCELGISSEKNKWKSVTIQVSEKTEQEKQNALKVKKKEIFQERISDGWINCFETNGIFVSEIDLENDLFKAIPEQLNKILPNKDIVKWLQAKKMYNMIELVSGLTPEIAQEIFIHTPVLKEFLKDD